MNRPRSIPTGCKPLYYAGGLAGLLAGVLVRRNLGAELSLFSPIQPPIAAADWFALLQTHRLLGLTYLGIFDTANSLLLALLFLALYQHLRQQNPGMSAAAALLGWLGVSTYIASNTALSMLSLSSLYTAGGVEKAQAEAAGLALLALNRFGISGAHPGSGGFTSLLLTAAGGLLFALLMRQDHAFTRGAAWVGLAANGLDLLYCCAYPWLPAGGSWLAVLFLPAAGLFFMLWHLLTGWGLIRLARAEPQTPE